MGLHRGPGRAGGVGLMGVGGHCPGGRRGGGVSPARDKRRKLLMARRCFSPKSCTWAGRRGELTISVRAPREPHSWGQAIGGRGWVQNGGSQFPTESVRPWGLFALRLRRPLGCGGIPDFITGPERAGCRPAACLGGGFPRAPHLPCLLPNLWRHGGLIPGSTIAGRGCEGTTWWTNS